MVPVGKRVALATYSIKTSRLWQQVACTPSGLPGQLGLFFYRPSGLPGQLGPFFNRPSWNFPDGCYLGPANTWAVLSVLSLTVKGERMWGGETGEINFL